MNQLDELPAVKPVEIFTRNNNEESQLGKETAARFDSGKPRYDLIPPYALHELVLVYTYGCHKYDPDNWWKGMQWRKVIGPMLRHIFKWMRGEKYDQESGLHHLAHAAWNAIALFCYQVKGLGVDDRQPLSMDLQDNDDLNKIMQLRKTLYNEDNLPVR
jgi:hypothetical protein